MGDIERDILRRLSASGTPIILVINKTDRSNAVRIAETIAAYSEEFELDAVVPTSAVRGKGVDEVLGEAEKISLRGPVVLSRRHLDRPDRAPSRPETIREKMLRLLSDEVPHGTAVVIEEFVDEGTLIRVRAEIYCEREAHKRIIIGHGGEMIKKIGSYAREDLEAFFGVKVHLDLWVKVKEKWRDSDYYLGDFGYDLKHDFE